ncbi:hypothetical protein ACIF70_20575 [Actinacidiphila glaucinigra]|uniref:hypothetical protein n=1 Tax=Actinacidiphila glaucinigra TaxID=235986 RepID=UPI002DD83DA9|nr:hypothetical protein [Actinacidiphila glaucinigra]WSD62034.1 DUF916 domain-containing protein [Actinacidiphila glaucinigra]
MITRSARRIAAVLAACVLAVLPAAETASAASHAASHTAAARPGAGPNGRTTFGVQPSSADKPDGRPNYSYGVTPGAVIRDHIAIWNYGAKPLTLNVYAADAVNSAEGGFDLLPRATKSSDGGTWIKLGRSRVTVAARSRVIVPFTLTVPRTVTPGDHPAGIVASLSAVRTGAKGDRVQVDQRVGARMYLRVAGRLRPLLSVEDLRTDYHGTANPFGTGTATVSYTVRNTGNVRLAAEQTVRVHDAFGGIATVKGSRDLAEILPGNALRISVTATGVLPTVRDTTTVSVDAVSVRGDVAIPDLPSLTRSQDFWAVPWSLLAVLSAVAAVATGWWLRRRRRRRGPHPDDARTAANAPKKRAQASRASAPVAMVLAALSLWAAAPAAHAAEPGGLNVAPRHGSATEPITLTASGPCPDGTRNVIAWVKGAGFPRDGKVVVGNSEIGTYPAAPGGGRVIPLTYTMQDYALDSGFSTLRGTYTFTVSCLEAPFGLKSLRDFSGSLRFTSKTSYTDGTRATPEKPAAGSSAQPGGTAGQGQPSTPDGSGPSAPAGGPGSPPAGSAYASGAPAQGGVTGVVNAASADPAGDAYGSLVAWSAGGFAVALLVLLAGTAQWVRGRRGRAARADTSG